MKTDAVSRVARMHDICHGFFADSVGHAVVPAPCALAHGRISAIDDLARLFASARERDGTLARPVTQASSVPLGAEDGLHDFYDDK